MHTQIEQIRPQVTSLQVVLELIQSLWMSGVKFMQP